jgi:nucleoside-diphosphate-sugar epimerase
MFNFALARDYAQAGIGLGGVILKQSLYPGGLLGRLLDGAGLVLDFGCGEGLLTNLLARRLPRTRFIGIDLDAAKIRAAQSCRANDRTEFHAGSFFDHPTRGASAVIFNDVLHHLPPDRQLAALQHAADCLDEDGLIVLKEVDPADRLDVRHTTFWDSRLYPKDELRFFPPAEWVGRMQNLGFRLLGSTVVRHPWVASRTLLWFVRRPKLAEFAPPLPTPPAAPAKTVLVTGGTGFIGEWLVRRLLASGLEGQAVRVDLITREPRHVPVDLAAHASVRILRGDLTDEGFTNSLTGPYEAVFHLAASVDYFGGSKVYENNLQATTQLLAACRRWPRARLVYTSTMGALDRSRWDFARTPLTETSPNHPTSPYGRAKVEEEARVRASGLNWTIVRIPWCYGPGMAESHHVRNLLNRVRLGAAVCRLHWPGRVSMVEVRDAARQLAAAVGNPRTFREVFFLAEDEPVAVGKLFAEMGRSLGCLSAGSICLPRWFWRILRLGLPLAPFQLKCLLTDALVVSTQKARGLGVAVSARPVYWLLPLARYNSHQLFPSRRCAPALITGSASGIGACLLRQLYGLGYPLILLDRNEPVLLQQSRLYSAQSWTIDLSDPSLAEKLRAAFPARLPWPALVINNAGIGWRGYSWDCPPADIQRIISVNALAPALIANFFLGQSPAPVVVVNIASTAAFQPLPHMAAYAAAKSFILSFSLALHAEVSAVGRSDHVLTVVPGGTETGFQAAAGVKTSAKERLLSPHQVAAAIVDAMARRRPLLFIGRRARTMRVAASLIPLSRQARLWEKLMGGLR